MVDVLLSKFVDWLRRLTQRPTAAPVVPPPQAVAPPPVPAPMPIPSLAVAPAKPPARADVPPDVSPEAAEECLKEVLGLAQLPPEGSPARIADPAVRAKTLAALDDLRQIPALQALAQDFLKAMNRDEVSVPEVIAAIEKDSALCVRVLRMANSVLISPEQRIVDLDTAVQMLGLARVRNAAQALFTLRGANRVAGEFDWRHLWIHALGTAAIAEEMEQQLRGRADSQVYLAGLLHDVGKIVLSTIAPDSYRDILVAAWNEHGRLEDLERAHLGVDHREAGVIFARHNSLPAVVIEAIAHHQSPAEAEHHRFEVALVTLANHLSKAHGLGFSGSRLTSDEPDFIALPAWEVVGEQCGFRPNAEQLEAELTGFVSALRADLKLLREEG